MLLFLLLCAADLSTVAERSSFAHTGRYAEVQQLTQAFERQYPRRIKRVSIGVTPQGRQMWVLVASDAPGRTAAQTRALHRPVILVQGATHAGEMDGKDAIFIVLRSILDGSLAPGLLERSTWVFLPVFNVDGLERFGPNQRPNQNGPAETGFRTNAQNLNLNRDYAKADSAEVQALLRFSNAWDPVLSIDLHVTDGSRHRQDVAILVAPSEVGSDPLRADGVALRDALVARLSAQGHTPVTFYPAFEASDDPSAGYGIGVDPPRYGLGYWSARDRLAMLVETHSWDAFDKRVKTAIDTVRGVAEIALNSAAQWRKSADAMDEAAKGLRGLELVLAWDKGAHTRPIEVLGYQYLREASPISGGTRIVYDLSKPELWRVPLKDTPVPERSVRVPSGYVVPRAFSAVIERLRVHGFKGEPVSADQSVKASVFVLTEIDAHRHGYEGRQPLFLQGVWQEEDAQVRSGDMWFTTAQAHARLLVHLLEPEGPDSFVAWGMLNSHFERKEYIEDYVLDAWATEQLKTNPTLARTFGERLSKDEAFAKSAEARLQFFYRRHPSWDHNKDRYPILRMQRPL